MSDSGHEAMKGLYTQELINRIGRTWASLMRCQDGDDFDTFPPFDIDFAAKNHPYIGVMQEYFPDRNLKILEVGAGDGSGIAIFNAAGWKNITGITVGQKNVSMAKKTYNVDLLYMDMHFTSFPNQSFDAIIGFETFEHTPSPLLLGLEFNRLLRPGGKIMMKVPFGEQHFKYEENPHHLNVMEPWQAKSILRRCGFLNVKTLDNLYYGEKIGDGAHNNHFDRIVRGEFV